MANPVKDSGRKCSDPFFQYDTDLDDAVFSGLPELVSLQDSELEKIELFNPNRIRPENFSTSEWPGTLAENHLVSPCGIIGPLGYAKPVRIKEWDQWNRYWDQAILNEYQMISPDLFCGSRA